MDHHQRRLNMKKTYEFHEVLDTPLEQVWEAFQNPMPIVSESTKNIDVVDELHWSETSNGVTNTSTAMIDASTHCITIKTESSKYASETNDISIQLHEEAGKCRLDIRYVIGTTAIFNIITFELLGKKIGAHVEHTLLKHLKKALK